MSQTVRDGAREHVGLVVALLSILSLLAIFAAVLGYVPDRLLPRYDPVLTAIPHLNAVLSLGAIGTITYGLVSIRRGEITPHRRAMLASAGLFATFLALYLYRVSIVGPTEFAGPDALRQFLYLPMLGVHILLAIVCLPFVFAALVIAVTHPTAELGQTRHPTVGRVAAVLWLISFSLGIGVYLLLHVVY